MELELMVTPFLIDRISATYCIWYRYKKRFNLFNFWKQLKYVVDDNVGLYYNTVLFGNYDSAVEYARKLKNNPKLLEEHYEREKKKYQEALKKRKENYKRCNKSIKI